MPSHSSRTDGIRHLGIAAGAHHLSNQAIEELLNNHICFGSKKS